MNVVDRHADRRRPTRPSLKITRHAGPANASGFTFEVWSPFAGNYQAATSIAEGLRRLNELAGLICQMWLHSHPQRDALVDVPDSERIDRHVGGDHLEWAEFRINAAQHRSYDTRRFDRLTWVRAAGMTEATKTTCATVGLCAAEVCGVVTGQTRGSSFMHSAQPLVRPEPPPIAPVAALRKSA